MISVSRLTAAAENMQIPVASGPGPGSVLPASQPIISLVFRKFSEIGSVRQLALWLRQEGIELPIAVYGRQGRTVQWRPPRYNTVHRLLTNPVYAGAYVFGRTGSRARLDGGRKVITHGVARPREEWGVLIRDRHDGYIVGGV
jgi:hypothetical protein